MTIKLRLIGIISVLGVAVVGLSVQNLLDTFWAWQKSEQALQLGRTDAALTRGLMALRFERVNTTSAMTLEPAKLAASLKEIGERRRTLDEAFASAFSNQSADVEAGARSDGPTISELYEQWRRTRVEVDAALAKPVAERDRSLSTKVVRQAANLVSAVSALVATTDARIHQKDPRLSNIIQVRAFAWTARNAAGDASVITMNVLDRGASITLKEQLDYAAADRETALTFGLVRNLVARMEDAQALREAVKTAQVGFFDGVLAERNRLLMPALADMSLPRPGVDETRAKFNPGLDLIAVVVTTAVGQLEAKAQTLAEDAKRTVLVQGLILALATILAVGGTIYVIRCVANPLATMARAMHRLARGDVGFPIPFTASRDEIGAMAGAVQVFKDNLIHTRRLEAETEQARLAAEEQRKAGMRQMADAFEAAVGGVIGMVSSSATELQATAQTMTATATQTASQSTTVAAAAEEAASNVSTVAVAVEELGASVQEIRRQVDGSAELARSAVMQADRTGQLVQELSTSVARIGDVAGMISAIASQTNLLALNATIEAARAGAAGRGFAVVAAEVKALADQTAKATEEITGQIGRIEGSTDQAVSAIGAIAARIREINGVATSIATAVEEQGVATQEIVRNVAQASAGTSEITSNIAGVAGTAEETGAAASQVLGAASELSRQSEHLSAEVHRFLATVRAA